jgi:hypothetical protein
MVNYDHFPKHKIDAFQLQTELKLQYIHNQQVCEQDQELSNSSIPNVDQHNQMYFEQNLVIMQAYQLLPTFHLVQVAQ